MKGGTLVWVQVVTAEFAPSHTTNCVDEIPTVKIFKPVLIWVMGVGTTVEVIRRRIFTTLLVTCILQSNQHTCNDGLAGTYTISFLIEHEGSDGPPGVGMVTGLTSNADSGLAPAVLILSSRNGTSGHQHGRVSGGSREVGITEVVDGERPANGVPYIPSRLGQ